MRAAIYARYSAGPQQTDQSIEGQLRVCEKYCADHNLEVVKIYADRHISGTTDERPEFQRMIQESALGLFDVLCVYKTDRFSRSKVDTVLYKKVLRDNGIKIAYAAETIPEGPEGVILESLMEGLAEYYSLELSQKVQRGRKENAIKGKFLGGYIPLGYKTKSGYFQIEENEAEIIRFIFRSYLDGYTIKEIIDTLTANGWKTRQGNKFGYTQIQRILQETKYIGIYEALGITHHDKIPPIISEADFMKAQEILARKNRPKWRKNLQTYPLSGKLFCGYCEKPMVGVCGTSHTGKKHYYYYYCMTQKKKKNLQ